MFEDLAIVVHTCDKYEFVWEGWYDTFTRNWNLDLGIDIYFVNEVKDVNLNGIKQLKTDIGEWSDRLKRALNGISHKHILYWQEDMWAFSPLKNFTYYYNDFVKYDMDYLSFMSQMKNKDRSWLKFHDKIYFGKYLKLDINNNKFIILHQPTIWKKDFFLEYLNHSEDPWVNELEASKRVKENNKIKEVNAFYIDGLERWYQPVVKKGEFSEYANDVRNGTFKV